MTQIFHDASRDAGYCTKCNKGYAVGPHVCPAEQVPSKKKFCDRFVDIWYELTSSPVMHTQRYAQSQALFTEADQEIERLQQRLIDVGVDNLGDNDEYARCRSLDDQQIIREAMETPIRMVHELGNRYDVVCEKLERAAPEPAADEEAAFYQWWNAKQRASFERANPGEPFRDTWGRFSELAEKEAWLARAAQPPRDGQ